MRDETRVGAEIGVEGDQLTVTHVARMDRLWIGEATEYRQPKGDSPNCGAGSRW